MNSKREKAFDKKVKHFDRRVLEIVTNIGVSMLTTLLLLEKLGLLR